MRVPAGDNVVRLLPPLIVTDAEIHEALDRIRAGAAAVSAPRRRRRKLIAGVSDMTGDIRHFTDLSAVSAADLRGMLDDAARAQGAAQGRRALAGRSKARCWR